MLTRPSAARSPLRNATLLLACAALATALSALAAPGLWKCAGGGGIPVYQDRPCANGADLKDLAADPPPLSIVPLHIAPPAASSPERTTPRRAQAPASRQRRADVRPDGHAAERKFVREGMTEGEVLARLGIPDMASPKGRRARWTFLPTPGDPQTMTTIRFEDGRVLSVERVTVR